MIWHVAWPWWARVVFRVAAFLGDWFGVLLFAGVALGQVALLGYWLLGALFG